MSFDLFSAVASLRAVWPTLPDVDRAEQISPILAAGMSRRTLAKAVGQSEALLRHILPLADARPNEKDQARTGLIGTVALLRLIKKREADEAKQAHVTQDRVPEIEAQRWAKQILSWISTELGSPYAKQALEEVRKRLAEAKAMNSLPKEKAPAGMATEEIISRCRPPEQKDRFYFAGSCDWLSRWSFYAIPDCDLRDRALFLAWTECCRGDARRH